MKTVTICFPIRDKKIYLAPKKQGFGVGFLNGYGGKKKDGETIIQTALRELNEESGVVSYSQDL